MKETYLTPSTTEIRISMIGFIASSLTPNSSNAPTISEDTETYFLEY